MAHGPPIDRVRALSAEAVETAGVVGGERVIVPADRAADRGAVPVDAASRVVGGRNTCGCPVAEPAGFAQAGRDSPRTGAGLTFQLEQVQLGDAACRPQISRQSNLGESSAVQVEGETLDRTGAEVPAGDYGFGADTVERLCHRRMLLSRE